MGDSGEARQGWIDKAYRQYRTQLHKYAYFKVGNWEHAEDLVHRAFFELCRTYSDGTREAPSNVRAWLFKVLRCDIKDYFDEKRRHGSRVEIDDSAADGSPSPVQQAIAGNESRRVWNLLGRLTERESEVMALLLSGLNAQKIAKVLGIRRGNVHVILSRARTKLRELLGLDDDDDGGGGPTGPRAT